MHYGPFFKGISQGEMKTIFKRKGREATVCGHMIFFF